MALSARPLAQTDIDAVLALLHGYDRKFFGEPMMDAEDVLGEWQAPSFDFDRDSRGWMADGSEALVAAGTLTGRGLIELTATPDVHATPESASMIDYFEQIARERGLAGVYSYLAEADTAGREQLASRGWTSSYVSWVLQLAADAVINFRELPSGYAIRPFRAGDERDVYTVVSDAFGEWQSSQRSFEDWEATVVRRPGGDPTRFRVATYAGPEDEQPRIVGASVVFDGADEAWVAQLAVHREHRHRGLAQQLLAESFAAARERGVAKGGLSTDTRTGALGLYERLGMRVFCSYLCMELSLSPTV